MCLVLPALAGFLASLRMGKIKQVSLGLALGLGVLPLLVVIVDELGSILGITYFIFYPGIREPAHARTMCS